MKEEIINLVNALCLPGVEKAAMEKLCDGVCAWLDEQLADHVSAEDCADRYVLSAAWVMMDWLTDARNWEGISSLSAGDMTVRMGEGSGKLTKRALEMLAPYLKDRNFVFRGVRG